MLYIYIYTSGPVFGKHAGCMDVSVMPCLDHFFALDDILDCGTCQAWLLCFNPSVQVSTRFKFHNHVFPELQHGFEGTLLGTCYQSEQAEDASLPEKGT